MLSEFNNTHKTKSTDCLYIKWYGAKHFANLFWIEEIKQEIDDKSFLSAAV